MIIKKSGRDLYAEFVCKICNCEYSAPLDECTIVPQYDYSGYDEEMLTPLKGAIASLNCPCCGFSENICKLEKFNEYTKYPKESD